MLFQLPLSLAFPTMSDECQGCICSCQQPSLLLISSNTFAGSSSRDKIWRQQKPLTSHFPLQSSPPISLFTLHSLTYPFLGRKLVGGTFDEMKGGPSLFQPSVNTLDFLAFLIKGALQNWQKLFENFRSILHID